MQMNPPFLRTQDANDVASRLHQRLKDNGRKIKSVHVVPSELTEWSGWGVDVEDLVRGHDFDPDADQKKLNRLLGQLAVSYVSGELANTLTVQSLEYDAMNGEIKREKDPSQFCLGIATGSTIYSLIDSFTFPSYLMANHLRIVPLVMGPLPETDYSAGFIAGMLANKIGQKLIRISKVSVRRGEKALRLSLNKRWIDLRQKDDSENLEERGKAVASQFQWVITGIGGAGGQLEDHVKEIYGKDTPKGLVGDICSRLFGADGNELKESLSDDFVAVTFQALEQMCATTGAGKRVIAIAGGLKKYHALRTLLLRKGRDLFNVLITDELTARRLLIDLPKPEPKSNVAGKRTGGTT